MIPARLREALPTFGLVVGAGVALVGLALRAEVPGRVMSPASNAGAVAFVDGRPVPRAAYTRELARLEAAGVPVDDRMRARIVERLVDEALLVRYGLELELAEDDPRLRVELARAVLDRLAADLRAAGEPDDAALARHLETHAARFARPRVRLVGALVSGEDAAERAAGLARALAAPEASRAADLDARATPLPSGPLDARTLAELVGPSATERVLAAGAGEVVGPLSTTDGLLVARIEARVDEPPSLERVRDAVRLDLERARADEALAALLRRLRARYPVRTEGP